MNPNASTGSLKGASRRVLRVFHLDDVVFELEQIETVLTGKDACGAFVVESFEGSEAFLTRMAAEPSPDVILLDIRLGRTSPSGVTLVERARALAPKALIVMRSSVALPSVMLEAKAKGADDYLSKVDDGARLPERLWEYYHLKNGTLVEDPLADVDLHIRRRPRLVAGKTMEDIKRTRIQRLIKSAVSAIYVSGESGVGKEVVAELFEAALPKTVPFVKVNAAALPGDLLESTLFGHVKGAFTDAKTDRKGLIEAAAGGWLFLDEVGDLSPAAQGALLRVLENGEVTPVGTNKPVKVEVRLITATNRSMPKLIRDGTFRLDLWYRLCQATIHLPPLRERREEIPDFIRFLAKTMIGGPYEVTPPALEILAALPWAEGNVRELRNCLRAMTETHVHRTLTPFSIPDEVTRAAVGGTAPEAPARAVKNEIVISWEKGERPSFEVLQDKLLLGAVQHLLLEEGGKSSYHRLGRLLKLSRKGIARRLRSMVERKVPGAAEVNVMIEAEQVDLGPLGGATDAG